MTGVKVGKWLWKAVAVFIDILGPGGGTFVMWMVSALGKMETVLKVWEMVLETGACFY